MQGYKIGEVSHIFDIPNETLRYYESKGLITARRDKASGYRYYDSWDMNYLLDSMWYRSFDFSLSDVEKMVREDDLNSLKDRCQRKEAELLYTINELQKKLKELSIFYNRINSIDSMLGILNLEDSPEMIWQRQRTKEKLEKGEGAAAVGKWVKLMPYVDHTFVMPEVKPVSGEFNEYCWGFSLYPRQLDLFKADIPFTAEYIPSYRSVHTVFCAGDEGTFMDAFNSCVIAPIKEKGHTVSNPPVGHLLARIHENGNMKRYFEVWVPVE